MTPGMSVVVSALNARWNQQELNAKNIGSSSGIGFKRKVSGFSSFDSLMQEAAGTAATARSSAGTTTATLATGFDMTPGELKYTSQPLDAGIKSEGYFAVKTSQGLQLTRNGHFSVDRESRLVDGAGNPVQGQKGDIRLPAGSASIESDGSILVNGVEVDKLGVFNPPAGAQLTSENGGLFAYGTGRLSSVQNPEIVPGALESSNIELPAEMVSMVQNQRMYDMLMRAYQTQDEGLGRAIQDLSA